MPSRSLDLTGFRRGDLEFLRQVGVNSHGQTLWECRCHRCGGLCVVPSTARSYKSGAYTNCGCRKREAKDYDVRAARIAAGLSRKQLGAVLGVVNSTIGNWERGKAHPRPDMLERIKEVLQEQTASTDAPVAKNDLQRPAPSYKMITRACAVCGREFETRASQPRETCSEACRGELVGQTHKAKRDLGFYIHREKPSNIKVWEIVSPKGKMYKIRNLEAWAREHCDLFGLPTNDASVRRIVSGFSMLQCRIRESDRPDAFTRFTCCKGWRLKGLPVSAYNGTTAALNVDKNDKTPQE